MTAAAEHCLDLVRRGDKDRFLASLFAPEEKRAALLAFYGFNIEIARVREQVSEPHLGEIRYQWWRDTLDGIYRGVISPHPVAQELARAIEAGDIPKAPLANLITAREFDLYDDPMPGLSQLEGYLGETSAALIQVASLVLAGRDALASAEAAGFAGVAYGLAGLVRSLPLHRSRGQNFLPNDMAVAAVVAHARTRLGAARALRQTVPRTALPAFLPVSLTDLYLDRAARLGEAARAQPVEISQFRRQARLWSKAQQETY